MQKKALMVSAIIFDIIAMLHLARLFLKFSVIIAGHTIPMWVSIPGFIIPQILAMWMFKAMKQDQGPHLPG